MNLKTKKVAERLLIKIKITFNIWKDIEFPPTSKDWRKFELNNKVALNILYVPHNTKKIQMAYRSKYNLIHEEQVILLMITDCEKWHYLMVKNLSGLLKE